MEYLKKHNQGYKHCIIWENEEGWQTMSTNGEVEKKEILLNLENLDDFLSDCKYFRGIDFNSEEEALIYEGITKKDIELKSVEEGINENLDIFIIRA